MRLAHLPVYKQRSRWLAATDCPGRSRSLANSVSLLVSSSKNNGLTFVLNGLNANVKPYRLTPGCRAFIAYSFLASEVFCVAELRSQFARMLQISLHGKVIRKGPRISRDR